MKQKFTCAVNSKDKDIKKLSKKQLRKELKRITSAFKESISLGIDLALEHQKLEDQLVKNKWQISRYQSETKFFKNTAKKFEQKYFNAVDFVKDTRVS